MPCGQTVMTLRQILYHKEVCTINLRFLLCLQPLHLIAALMPEIATTKDVGVETVFITVRVLENMFLVAEIFPFHK